MSTAAEAVVRIGPGALLAKVDLRNAYRMLPIHPDDRWLLGMQWEGSLFVETALPFGLRSALKPSSAVADALQWIAEQEGFSQPVMHYLDDFLLIGTQHSSACGRNIHAF